MNEKSTYKSYIAPALVLVVICLVVTAALAGTYSITNPIIEANTKAAADEARAQVLPSGDSFTQYDGKLVEGVTECYIADNKTGMAVTATSSSYGGLITVMIGIDQDGKVTGVTVTEHGTKAMTEEYLAGYKGKDALEEDNIKNDSGVDYIAGATISSNAIYQTVKEALQQFQECGGVK